MPYLGELASFLFSACLAANAVLYSKAGKRVGSATVNAMRLGLGLALMLLLHLALTGRPFPWWAGPRRMAFLGVSGLIGLAVADAMLFEAYVLLGPRLTVLVYTLWPVFTALLAKALFRQAMGPAKAAAMLATLAGIALVVAEKHRPLPGQARPDRFGLGLGLAVGGALGQAIGFIFSKLGMAGGFSPVSGNVIRLSAATLALWAWQAVRGDLLPNARRLRDGRAALYIGLGAVFGPVLGVMLSLYAVGHARYLGVASTLMSLSPVLLLPYSVFLEKERIRPVAVFGTLACIAGVAGMFLL